MGGTETCDDGGMMRNSAGAAREGMSMGLALGWG
jgi:hypothetical protein